MRALPALAFLLGSCTLYYRPDAGPDAGALPDASVAQGQKFRSLVDAYVSWYYSVYPTQATAQGIHERDGELGHFARADIEAYRNSLLRHLGRLSQIDRGLLAPRDLCDIELFESHVRAGLLVLGQVRPWERSPLFYQEVITRGLYALVAFDFAPRERRIALAVQRLEAVPELLGVARENLTAPPRLFVEVGLGEMPGTLDFLRRGLPRALGEAGEERLRERFRGAHERALQSLEGFAQWMKDDLLPRSVDEFALGAEILKEKLRDEEMVETPLQDLLREGQELLRKTQDTLASLNPERRPGALHREEKGPSHPEAGRLIEEARASLGRLRAWASSVAELPSLPGCRVQETPEFRRGVSLVSLDCPGPFETAALEVCLSLTLPDRSWTPEQSEEHLSRFNRFGLPLLLAREVYPGSGACYLAARSASSKIRKIFGSRGFLEGWGQYCLELYAEKGPDPSVGLRAEQLSMEILGLCRYVVGIRMHSGGMSVKEATDFFIREGSLEPGPAEGEARRAALDPGVLSRTLGTLGIRRLRDEYLRAGHTLGNFHAELLRHGTPPVAALRKILLGGAS